MKLIIDIPEGIYLNARTGYLCDSPTLAKAIENGIPYEEQPTGEMSSTKQWARYNIQHPETKQCTCFSSIGNDFICDWMDRDKYMEWLRLLEEERDKINRDINRPRYFMSVVEEYNRIFKHSGKKGGKDDE